MTWVLCLDCAWSCCLVRHACLSRSHRVLPHSQAQSKLHGYLTVNRFVRQWLWQGLWLECACCSGFPEGQYQPRWHMPRHAASPRHFSQAGRQSCGGRLAGCWLGRFCLRSARVRLRLSFCSRLTAKQLRQVVGWMLIGTEPPHFSSSWALIFFIVYWNIIHLLLSS